jgi:hypothetical protein
VGIYPPRYLPTCCLRIGPLPCQESSSSGSIPLPVNLSSPEHPCGEVCGASLVSLEVCEAMGECLGILQQCALLSVPAPIFKVTLKLETRKSSVEDPEPPSLGSFPLFLIFFFLVFFFFFAFLDLSLGSTLSFSSLIQATRVKHGCRYHVDVTKTFDSIHQFIYCQGMSQEELCKPLIQIILKP